MKISSYITKADSGKRLPVAYDFLGRIEYLGRTEADVRTFAIQNRSLGELFLGYALVYVSRRGLVEAGCLTRPDGNTAHNLNPVSLLP